MPTRKPKLSVEQIELVAQFSDHSAGRQFKREAKAVFDQEREERAE